MKIEARYIDVEWNSNKLVEKVVIGSNIELVAVDEHRFSAETITFQKEYSYFAFKVEGNETSPYFTLNEHKEELILIKDPKTGEIWWIAQGVWLPDTDPVKYSGKFKYSHEVWRSSGDIKLCIDNVTIQITNRTNSLTAQDLKALLQDFKDELWRLILEPESIVGTDIQKSAPNIFNKEVLDKIESFIKAAKKVVKEPNYLLAETQSLASRKQVKPINKTFRELATKPDSTLLTSREHVTKYDTPENKFVHFCAQKIYRLLSKMDEVIHNGANNLEQQFKSYQEEANLLKESLTKPKLINEGAFLGEIREIEEKLQELTDSINRDAAPMSDTLDNGAMAINTQLARHYYLDIGEKEETYIVDSYSSLPDLHGLYNLISQYQETIEKIWVVGVFEWVSFSGQPFPVWICKKLKSVFFHKNKGVFHHTLQLGAPYGKSKTKFFCKFIDGIDCSFKSQQQLPIVVSFDESLEFTDISNTTIQINGYAIKSQEVTTKNKPYLLITWKKIYSCKLIGASLIDKLNQKIAAKQAYEKNGWLGEYSREEREDLQNRIQVLSRKSELFDTNLESFTKLSRTLSQFTKGLRGVLVAFKELKVNVSNTFPNSMTFIQNPVYKNSYRAFKFIFDKDNISLEQLENLILIEKIGITHISRIYELWILLAIIKILKNEFGFQFYGDWKTTLILGVLNNTFDIEFRAEMKSRLLELTLTYEKVLPNNKRPDFVLDIKSKIYQFDERRNKFTFLPEHNANHRLVMDAKFYDDHSEQYVVIALRDLIEHKGYSQNGKSRVFIIHPKPFLIDKNNITSPFFWGKSSDYGHVHPNNHKSGYIFVSPKKDINALTNLKRLILMHLQESTNVLFAETELLKNNQGYSKLDPFNEALRSYSAGKTPYSPSIFSFGLSNQNRAQEITSGIRHNYFCPNCTATPDMLIIKGVVTKNKGIGWFVRCKKCSAYFKENFCYGCHRRLFKNGPNWVYHRVQAEYISNCRCPACDADLSQATYY